MTQTRSTSDASASLLRRLAAPALGVLLALVPALACKPGEKASGTAPPASASAPATTPVAAADQPPVLREIAEAGRAPWSGLAEPRGAALDGRGRIWVSDFGHSRIAVFDLAGGPLGGWGGTKGNGKYQLQDPGDVAIRGDDVYVADTWNGRVQHFNAAGQFRDTAVAELYGPRGVAVAQDGSVWIADSGNNRLVVLQAGQPNRLIGKAGAGADGFSFPVGVAASPSRVYVADIGNHRIQVLGLDGKFQAPIPVAAWKETMEPYVAVDEKDHVFASVPAASAVLELDRAGKVLHRWDVDDAGKKLLKPTGLAFDGKSRILYVVDAISNAVGTVHVDAKKP